jgi:hypothetical protein
MSRVDDLVGLGDRLIDQGVYIGAPGGGKITKMGPETVYFYPSPHDMQGLMAELCRIDMRNDPRLLNTWSSQVKFWELSHPLGIKRLAYITLGVRDLSAAVDTYVQKTQAVPITEGASTMAVASTTPSFSWVIACCRSLSPSTTPRRSAPTSRSGAT